LDVSELNLHYPIIVSQLSKLEIRTGHSWRKIWLQ
jgi:hypothetical protein